MKGRFLVIESDDWGSIRIPNPKVQNELLVNGLINLSDPFSAYDCLESGEDYKALFDVLKSFKDSKGNHPIFTANMVMANPDFEKINTNHYKSYYKEPFTKTYTKYYPGKGTFEVLKKGIEQNLIYPQYHAREHLNVTKWMQRLQSGDERYLKAFHLNCFAIIDHSKENNRGNLMASYDYQNEYELNFINQSIIEGLQTFKELFGFTSKSTIAPCYVWNENIEKMFNETGVKSLQSSYIQNKNGNGKYKRLWRSMGSTNELGQRYFLRNVLFEPAFNNNINWIEKAFESIAIAFFWGKPAIISSHRLNYVSGLSQNNRDNTLQQLSELIGLVMRRWPDTIFLSSDKLLNVL